MSIAPLVFQGVSSYSTDFQSIVDRAVSIAQIPLKSLQNQQSDLITKKMSATNLSTAVASLGSAVKALGTLGTNKALAATSSDSTKVTATTTGATQGSYYAITDITSVASAASETSLKSYSGTDTVSTSGKMTLTVGSKSYAVDVSANNTLAGLRDAINALSGTGVSASVITTSGGSYLSISASDTGKNAISLTDYPVTGGTVNGAVAITTGVNDQLTIATDAGTETLTLANTDASLADVAQDINTLSKYATASVTTDGDGNSRLVIQSKTAGSGATVALSGTAITAGSDQLKLGSTAVLTSLNPGSNAEFKLNGISVSKSGNVVNDLVDGVTFTIKDTTDSGQTVGITLKTDRTQLSSALSTLVTAYNSVADQVNAQIGPSAGLLAGNSIIRDARGAMLAMTTYSGGTGQVQSLAALGIELDATGKMSLNSSTFNALSDSQVTGAFSFLGTEKTGFGGLQSRFTQISDSKTGTIKSQLDVFAATDKRLTKQISDMTDRINAMQTALQAKLQKADALLASLDSQKSLLTASVQSLNFTSYGKDPSSNG